jgi:hypothetical protein
MNKERRKELDRAAALITEAAEIISNAAQQEEEYFDFMPENLQGSERGERAEEVAGELSMMADELGEYESRIDELKE